MTPYAEQGHSLRALIEGAGLQHDDEATLEFEGVGVHTPMGSDVPSVAFCPTIRARVIGKVQVGESNLRKMPIPECITLSRGARRLVRKQLAGRNGFLKLRATIHTNGSIRISRLEILNYEPAVGRVSNTHCYREFLARGTV